MKIGFILFDGMTTLDFVGFYDAITRLKTMGFKENLTWEFCGISEKVSDDRGINMEVTRVFPKLSEFDMIFIPGGMATRQLVDNKNFIKWIRTGENVPLKVSVCTGSLLLGAAGFLKDKKVTTHPNAFELIRQYCGKVVNSRIVKDNNIITGGGVASSVDLGLYLCELIVGKEAVENIMKQMDYPYYNLDGLLVIE